MCIVAVIGRAVYEGATRLSLPLVWTPRWQLYDTPDTPHPCPPLSFPSTPPPSSYSLSYLWDEGTDKITNYILSPRTVSPGNNIELRRVELILSLDGYILWHLTQTGVPPHGWKCRNDASDRRADRKSAVHAHRIPRITFTYYSIIDGPINTKLLNNFLTNEYKIVYKWIQFTLYK